MILSTFKYENSVGADINKPNFNLINFKLFSMREKIKFENGILEKQINQDAGFKKLILVSANINKIEDVNVLPFVELILSNDDNMFKSYSNLIPSTNNLNCFDLLKVSTNYHVLSNKTFHTLKCLVPDNLCVANVVIEMEFEIE